MKFNKIYIPAVLIVLAACKKPTQDLKIVVDTDVIKYTALIHVTDATTTAAVPSNATITISGAHADDIYEASGKKNIKLVGGVVTIGPGPNAMPVSNQADTCIVNIKAPGYNSVSRQVIFTAGQPQQVVHIGLGKLGQVNNNNPTPPVTDAYNLVKLNFTGICHNRTDVELRPSMYVFYRETGTGGAFQYLGYMDKGLISSTALAPGKNYDFQITYGGQNYLVSQLISGSEYNLQIDMGTSCDDF